MLKNITMIVAAMAITGCASTEPEFTTDTDRYFKPDFKNHSVAYNIAAAGGAPDMLHDEDVLDNELERVSSLSKASSFATGFLANGLTGALSFGLMGLSGDDAKGFDEALFTMWVEVDSLEAYGSDDFEEMVYNKVHTLIKTKVISADDKVIEYFGGDNRYYSGYSYNGPSCVKYWEDKLKELPKDYQYRGDKCGFTGKVKIIRPVKQGDWLPSQLPLNKNSNHVVVNLQIYGSYPNQLQPAIDIGFLYRPNIRTIKAMNSQGDWKSLKVKRPAPSYQYEDTLYYFITPNEAGQRGTFTLNKSE